MGVEDEGGWHHRALEDIFPPCGNLVLIRADGSTLTAHRGRIR